MCQVCGDWGTVDGRYCRDCCDAMQQLARCIARGSFLTRAKAAQRIESMLRNIREEHQEYHRSDT